MRRLTLLCLLTWSTLGPLFAQGDRFFVTLTNGDLYKVHVLSCNAVLIGSTGQSFSDIALTPSGELYGGDNGDLYRIDTSDASAVLVDTSSFIGNALVALNDTTLLTVAYQRLYAVKTTDASTTLIGTVGYSPLGDLTWYDGHLFMSCGIEQLVQIDTEDDWASISSVTPIGVYDPLMPGCEGLATTMVSDSASSIVGFRFPDLFCFSPVDGTYQIICQPPFPGWVPGAAAEPPTPTPESGCTGMHNSMADVTPSNAVHTQVVNGQLVISLPVDHAIQSIRLTDMSGKLVRVPTTLTPTGAVSDLNELGHGLYVVEVLAGDDRFVERIINWTQE